MKTEIADNTEIRGINIKTLRTTIAWGVSSMMTLIVATFWITSTLKNIEARQDKINVLYDIRMKALEVQVESMKADLKILSQKVETITYKLGGTPYN